MKPRTRAFRFARVAAILVVALGLVLPGQALGAPSGFHSDSIRLPITEPPVIDPGLATDHTSLEIASQLFEGLVGFDENNNIYGVGAERWDVSEDGRIYWFYLRPGMTWSDGNPVTAWDYEWAWRRNIDPTTASDYATTLYPVLNAERIHKGELTTDNLGARALDDLTFEVVLTSPAAYFMRLASTWTLFPLPRWAIEANGDKWTEAANIVTNGKFRLEAWDHNRELVMVRNDGYWGTKPLLSRATFVIYPEGAEDQVLAGYEAGELDVFTTVFALPPAHVDRVMTDPTLSQEVKLFQNSGTMFITVNNRRPHLNDPRVRQAMGMVLERDLLINQILKRPAAPAFSLQPEGIIGRDPSLWPAEDVGQAQALFAAAGYPNGEGFPTITFSYNSSTQWATLAQYLQQRWKDTLGINVRLEAMEWAVFLKWRRGADWADRGDVYRGGWLSDYEDPNNWYNVLWDSREDPGIFNSGWANPVYDSLVRRGQTQLDPDTRQLTYQQAEAVLAVEYPNIPVFHYADRALVKPYVDGYMPSRILGFTPLDKVSLLPH